MKIKNVKITYLKHLIKNDIIEDEKELQLLIEKLELNKKFNLNTDKIKSSIKRYNNYIFNARLKYYKKYMIK